MFDYLSRPESKERSQIQNLVWAKVTIFPALSLHITDIISVYWILHRLHKNKFSWQIDLLQYQSSTPNKNEWILSLVLTELHNISAINTSVTYLLRSVPIVLFYDTISWFKTSGQYFEGEQVQKNSFSSFSLHSSGNGHDSLFTTPSWDGMKWKEEKIEKLRNWLV